MKVSNALTIFFILMIIPIHASTDLPTNSDIISVQGFDASSFVSRWDTTKISTGSSNSTQIKLPLVSSGSYNFSIDWGDGIIESITSYNQPEIMHNYITGGVYSLIVNGTLIGWQFNYAGDKLKIIEISQWGVMGLGNTSSYFYGCSNLVLTATDAPDLTETTSLYQAFSACSSLGSSGSMSTWDVSNITIMSYMFSYALSFNQPISNWNVSSVTMMEYMFAGSSFNLPLDNWDVSRVTYMYDMFSYDFDFNQPLNNWNVSSVITMYGMFSNAKAFNQPLDKWDVSNLTTTHFMFHTATSFDQPLGSWDVSSVSSMDNMFLATELSHQNYDDLLIGWSKLTLKSNVVFHGGNSKYSNNASAARQYIINTYGWTIQDNGFIEFDNPIISNPDDVSYKKGATGNQIVWVVEDLFPDNFNVKLDGVIYATGIWTNGSIKIDIDDLTSGVFEFIINVYDNSGNMASDNVTVTVFENNNPDLSSPKDVSYRLGVTGNQIIWSVGDQNPGMYNVTLDGTLFTTDTWTNGTISVTLNDLSLGDHTFILNAYDSYGNVASDIVIVTILENTAPTITSPDDISYELGATDNQIVWNVNDQNPGKFNITLDGALHQIGTWSNGTIMVNIDGLSVGLHKVIINVYDSLGNVINDLVEVTVTDIDSSMTSVDTHPTTTTSNIDTDNSPTPLATLIFIFSLGVITIFQRKRN